MRDDAGVGAVVTAPFDRELVRGSAETLRRKRLGFAAPDVSPGRGWDPLGERMTVALAASTAGIGDVVAKLVAIQGILDELPPSPTTNRVSAFNELYLKITRRVSGVLGGCRQPGFLELLDVEFAKRYFAAIALWNADDVDTPDAWEVLFKRGSDLRLTRLAAAMLGVNAHINHDLALALVDTWAYFGAPEDDVIHPDYLLVNEIFYAEIPPLRRGFSTRWQLEIDQLVGPLDDWSQRMLVTVTRARAWEQGRRLWLLRDDPADFEQARRAMDRAASLVAEWAVAGDRIIRDAGLGITESWDAVRRRVKR